MRNKILFYSLYVFLLLIPVYTIYSNSVFDAEFLTKTYYANLGQRFFGLILFTAMFVQIMIGMYMTKLTEKLGGWIFKFHEVNGILIYSAAIAHGISFALFNYFIGKGIDPLYVFVDVCLYCKGNIEWLYNLGRISFWLLTFAVIAGKFRTSEIMRIHWRKFHTLNYLAFLVAALHGFLVGTDFRVQPFYSLAIVMIFSVVIGLLTRFIPFKTTFSTPGKNSPKTS